MTVHAVHERYLDVYGDLMFLRHSDIVPGRATILLVHGLGESGLCFAEAFEELSGLDQNIVVPDCIGYGRSAVAQNGDYSFTAQAVRLKRLVQLLKPGRVTIVGHSLGGMIATCWAATDSQGVLCGLMNVEGNLTAEDATFSRLAVEAFSRFAGDMRAWGRWYHGEFVERLVLDAHGDRSVAVRRYYASLWCARPEAFLINAQELIDRTGPLGVSAPSAMAQLYAGLKLPAIYCWGGESLSDATRRLLETEGLRNQRFENSGHWPMIDATEAFYGLVAEFAA